MCSAPHFLCQHAQATAGKARAAFEAARVKALEAERRSTEAHVYATNRAAFYTSAVRSHHAALERTADEAIDEFCAEMRARKEANRHALVSSEIPTGPVDPWTGQRAVTVTTNLEEIRHAATAIDEAIEAATALKLAPSQAEIPARLDELRRTIPSVL